jgi:type IV secretion system protein VirB10
MLGEAAMKASRFLAAGLATLLVAAIGGASAQEARPGGQAQNPPAQQQADTEKAPAPQRPGKILVPEGTQLPLVLHNSVSTKRSKPGDGVYLETVFPIIVEGKIVIPAGSYVSGEVVDLKRPGRVKGRGEMMVRLNTLILPNGYSVDLNAVPNAADTGGGDTVDGEGKLKGDTDKGADAGVVLRTTAMGAGIGAAAGRAAGNTGRGAGIGLGAGAAAGLIAVLMGRGPEVEMPRGTMLEVVLNRPLYLDANKAQFTDPGRASSLAGPSNRQPARTRFPY